MRIVDVDCLSITDEITNCPYLELGKEKNNLNTRKMNWIAMKSGMI